MTHYPFTTAPGYSALVFLLLASGSIPSAQAQSDSTSEQLPATTVALTFARSALNRAVAHEARNQRDEARESFSEAADELTKATEARPDDGDAHLLLGLAYLFLGDERAAAAIERSRAAGERPRDRLLDLAANAGQSLAAGDREAAVRHLTEVLDGTAERLWQGLAFDRPPLLAGQLGVGISTDTNPNLLDDELILLTPDEDLVDGNDSDQVASLDLQLATRPLYERAGWTLGVVLTGRRSYHESHDFLDFGRARVVALAARGQSPLGYLAGPLGHTRVRVGASRVALLLQGGGEYQWLGSSSYRRAVLAGASVVVYPGRATATQADLVYQDRTYFEAGLGDPLRSGEEWSLGLSQTFYFKASDRFLRLGVSFADSRAGRPFESSRVEGALEANLPLGRLWNLYLETALGDEDYDHPESDLFNPSPGPSTTPREDSTWRVGSVVGRRLSDRLALALHVTYTRRDSSPDQVGGVSLDYERLQAGAHLRFLFGGAS